jgi:hypothetical protein
VLARERSVPVTSHEQERKVVAAPSPIRGIAGQQMVDRNLVFR